MHIRKFIAARKLTVQASFSIRPVAFSTILSAKYVDCPRFIEIAGCITMNKRLLSILSMPCKNSCFSSVFVLFQTKSPGLYVLSHFESCLQQCIDWYNVICQTIDVNSEKKKIFFFWNNSTIQFGISKKWLQSVAPFILDSCMANWIHAVLTNVTQSKTANEYYGKLSRNDFSFTCQHLTLSTRFLYLIFYGKLKKPYTSLSTIRNQKTL